MPKPSGRSTCLWGCKCTRNFFQKLHKYIRCVDFVLLILYIWLMFLIFTFFIMLIFLKINYSLRILHLLLWLNPTLCSFSITIFYIIEVSWLVSISLLHIQNLNWCFFTWLLEDEWSPSLEPFWHPPLRLN